MLALDCYAVAHKPRTDSTFPRFCALNRKTPDILPASFNEDQYGNYIYTRRNNEDRWVPIYIGEGDLGDRVSDNHHKAKCIKSKGATHVHVHLTANKKAGQAEEADLLARFTNALMPHGCNEAPGG